MMRTEDAIQLFLTSRQSKGLSPQTIRWYRGILLLFGRRFPQLPKRPEDIEQFLANLKVGDERKHGYYRTFRCFYRFLSKRTKIKNPIEMIDPPKRVHKEPEILMPEDLNRLLIHKHSPQMRTAILFLIDTGARLGELANLTIDKLEETPWGFVATISGKTGMRTVPISYETYHALRVGLPFHCKKHWLGRLISRAFKNAGVKGNALLLRHTFATLWEGDELVLQRIMGHAHLSTTRIYRHLRTRILSSQHNQYSPLKMALSTSQSML